MKNKPYVWCLNPPWLWVWNNGGDHCDLDIELLIAKGAKHNFFFFENIVAHQMFTLKTSPPQVYKAFANGALPLQIRRRTNVNAHCTFYMV